MILVTGAAGFIGSNLVADLETAGLGPLAVCDSFGMEEKWRNLAKREIAAFVRPRDLREWLRETPGVKAVLHMGAISSTTERDADLLVETNIQLTVDLWDICAARGIPYVYASSAAAYGGLETGLVDSEDPADIARLLPLNAYGWSKAATDRLLMRRVAEGRKAPPQWVGLRFFNVYGPNEYHKGSMKSVVAHFFGHVRDGRDVPLFRSDRAAVADGEQKRDFVYVKDCTAAILWFLANPDVSGIFNIGTGTARSFNDLIRAVGAALGTEARIGYVDMPEVLKARYQYFTRAEMGKLAAAGRGPEHFRSVEAGVRDYVLAHLATDDPYR